MQRHLFRGVTQLELLFNFRALTLSSVHQNWNHVAYTRNLDLGRHIYEASAVKRLIDEYPEWSASEINDVTQGIADNDLIHSKVSSLELMRTSTCSNDVFATLGEARLKDDTETVSELLSAIYENCLVNISQKEVETLIKQQHPKHLLKSISEMENRRIFLDTNIADSKYEATVYCDDHVVCTETHDVLGEAERRSCLRALKKEFPKQFDAYDIQSDALPLEDYFDLGSDAYKQRVVSLKKPADTTFGFTIRGGERKVIRNKEYIQLHIITPVFISHVENDSAAEKCGLKVGDVLLAVNDHSLVDVTHSQAVTSLKKFTDREEVNFTVKFAEKEVYKHETEQRFLEREKESIRDEIKSDRMGRWHSAKAKADPEEYYLEKFEHKKRPYQHNKIRKSLRLWDYKP